MRSWGSWRRPGYGGKRKRQGENHDKRLEIATGEVGEQLQKTGAAPVAEALQALEKFRRLGSGVLQAAAMGDGLREFQAIHNTIISAG